MGPHVFSCFFCALEAPTIAKRRFRGSGRDRQPGKSLRINEQIRVSPIRLIGEDDEQLGIIDIEEARRRAADAESDLVEVAPQADPPVCRIMDYGKWKYQQRKKDQKARSHAKQSELKEVRVRPKTDAHDMQIKTDHARAFLKDGDKVQFTMLFRGREMAHRDLAQKSMLKIAENLADISKVENPPRQQGRRMTMVLSPEKPHPASPGKQPAAGREASPAAPETSDHGS